jgi:hypothetical protein
MVVCICSNSVVGLLQRHASQILDMSRQSSELKSESRERFYVFVTIDLSLAI